MGVAAQTAQTAQCAQCAALLHGTNGTHPYTGCAGCAANAVCPSHWLFFRWRGHREPGRLSWLPHCCAPVATLWVGNVRVPAPMLRPNADLRVTKATRKLVVALAEMSSGRSVAAKIAEPAVNASAAERNRTPPGKIEKDRGRDKFAPMRRSAAVTADGSASEPRGPVLLENISNCGPIERQRKFGSGVPVAGSFPGFAALCPGHRRWPCTRAPIHSTRPV